MSPSSWVMLRHGESTANREGVYSGWQDVPLTPLGEEQAREAGRVLHDAGVTRIISSDLQRASATAELAAREAGLTHLAVERFAGLRERHLGAWQGQDRARLKRAHPDRPLTRWSGAAPGGETLAVLADRVLSTLAALSPTSGTTLLVAHGGVIRVLLGLLDGTPPDSLWTRRIANASPIPVQVPPGTWGRLHAALPAAPPAASGLG